jgi:hypothetical protein
MLIKVLPNQIPLVWEHVKFAVTQINEIAPENLTAALTRLLHDLLNEKAQCWVTLNQDRVLLNISITRVGDNSITGERELNCLFLYAYQGMTDSACKGIIAAFREFARITGCTRITGASRHPRLCELLEQHGLIPEYRTFTLTVEG